MPPDFANAIHVRTDDQAMVMIALEEVLARAGFDAIVAIGLEDKEGGDPTRSPLRRFFVSPVCSGWVSVFDENFVDIFDLAPNLSAETGAPALFLWSQGDRAWGYTLVDAGQTMDQYSSDPRYLEGESEGKPEVLARYSAGTAEQFRNLFGMAGEKGISRASMKVFAQLFKINNAESDYEELSTGNGENVEFFDEFVQMTFLRRQAKPEAKQG